MAEGEAGVVDDHADVGDVVVEPLELEEDDAEPARARRHLAARERLERLAVGERVARARVARDALGKLGRALEGQRLEELLGALVDEAEPRLEVHDRLALDAEAEVAGLDDARVHGPHRDLEDALALDAAERKRLARVGELATQRRVAAERVIALGPELVEREAPRIGVAARREAEEVTDLALEPARRERARRERGEARVGRVHGDEGEGPGPERRWRERAGEREVAAPVARVRGGEELAHGAERGEPVGERRERRRGKPALDRERVAGRDALGARLDECPREVVERQERHLSGPRSSRCARARRRARGATRGR